MSENISRDIVNRTNDLINTIRKKCYDFESLYSLEDQFNELNLAIRSTIGGRMVLCKMIDGIPTAEELFKDYMFVGSQNNLDEEISERLLGCIIEFITSHMKETVERSEGQLALGGHMGLYGKITVISEDVNYILQNMGIEEAIGTLSEWIDGNRQMIE